MPRVSKLERRLRKDDPNNIRKINNHDVKFQNDYVDWSSLNGNVKVYQLSSEEVKRLGIIKNR